MDHLAAIVPMILTTIFVGLGIIKYALEAAFKTSKKVKTKKILNGFLEEIKKLQGDIDSLKGIGDSPEISKLIINKNGRIAELNNKITEVKNGK